MAINWLQVSATFDCNVDLYGIGWNDYDIIAPTEISSFFAPSNGPIVDPAPWSMEYRVVKAGFTGGAYSQDSVWSGPQIFTTPDGQWVRRADRAYSNGAMTFTSWIKTTDFNTPSNNVAGVTSVNGQTGDVSIDVSLSLPLTVSVTS